MLNLDKSGWETVRLGEVVRPSKEKCDPTDGSVERYVAGEHMDTDDLRIHRWGDVGDGYLGPAFHRRFHPGQVLYGSRRTYLRKVAVADFDGVCANTTFVLDAVPTMLSPRFLPFVMSSEPFHAFAVAESRGSVNPYVNWSDIARFEFPLPPLEEQERIADLLWSIQQRSAALRHTAVELDRLLAVAAADSYVRAEESFPKVAMASLGELTMGRQKAPQHASGPNMRPFLRVGNIGRLKVDTSDLESMNFSDSEVAKYCLAPGDVLLTEGDLVSEMNVGRPAVFRGEVPQCCFQNTLIRFRPDAPEFADGWALLFEGMRLSAVFARAASTTTVSHLGLRRLSGLSVPRVDESFLEHLTNTSVALSRGRDALEGELEGVHALQSSTLETIWGGVE